MSQLVFRKIRWKNFLSTGNIFTEIDLQSESTTLIIGTNGSGKSTMLDAICFALFGKPFRNVNKPQLLNSINQKDGLVEVEFDIGSKEYKVIRGIKPNVFEIYCDKELVTQNAANRDYQEQLEKYILKLNYKSFTQIVILGAASFIPFMQLSSNDRRLVIEDLLDIQIFSRMNTVLRERYAKLKDDIQNIKNRVELSNEKFEIHSAHMKTLRRDKLERITQKNQQLNDAYAEIETMEAEGAALLVEINDLKAKTDASSSLKDKIQKYDMIEKNLKKTLNKVNGDIELYNTSLECPTCKQGIPHEHKTSLVEERMVKLTEVNTAIFDLTTKYNETVDKLNDVNRLLTELTKKSIAHGDVCMKIFVEHNRISTITHEINAMERDKTDVGEIQKKIDDLLLDIGVSNATHESLLKERVQYDAAINLLKDTGIKTKIIRQYIPIINKLINKYLSAMDFFVNFTLDESFKETIKSRHRDDFSYESFSEGEKQRIDMALMLTWRAVAKLKNSSNTNLLILDEVFDSSLDVNGTEDLMKILGLLESTNLFVISHKGDILQDKFRNVIRFEKVNNFSRIAK